MLLCLLPTILGCSPDEPVKLNWEAPLVVDLTAASCPEIDAKTRAEFAKTTVRPKADTTDPESGKPSVSKRATREWIDALELSERRKNKAARAVIKEHDKCRGHPPKSDATS